MPHIARRHLRRAATGDAALDSGQIKHLGRCDTCAARAAWYELLLDASADMRGVEPPRAVFEVGIASPAPAIGAPGSEPTIRSLRVSPRSTRLLKAAAIIAGVSALLIPVTFDRAAAGASELTFERTLAAGASVGVEYVPSRALALEDSVVVRARFRRAKDRRYDSTIEAVRAAVLSRAVDGRFRGVVPVPETAVYATFAVESADGQRVDANFGRLFDALVENPLGERASLQQQVNDLLERSWAEAIDVQRLLTARFPDDPLAWQGLLAMEQEIVSSTLLDSLKSVHRARLRSLDESLESRPGGDAAGAMMWYGLLSEDEELRGKWRRILIEEYPTHPRAVEQRAFDIVTTSSGDEVLLRRLEALWAEVGPAHVFLTQSGLTAALRVGDPEKIRAWAGRYLTTRPEAVAWVGQQLLTVPALREEAIELLEAEIRRMTADGRRLIGMSRPEFELERAPVESRTHLALARALGRDDAGGRGETHLRRALELDWNPSAYRELADWQRDQGASESALVSLARAAADPAASPLDADSASSVLGRAISPDVWARAKRDAEQIMYRQIERRSQHLPLDVGIDLRHQSGSRHDLGGLLRDRVTVLAYWSPYCGPALTVLAEIERLARRLEARGHQLILVTSEPRDPAVEAALQEYANELETYYDETRELARQLEQFGTPAFHVLDDTGSLRFRDIRIGEIDRVAAAIGFDHP